MKINKFISKHKFLLCTLPLILTTVIMLFVLGFSKPKHAISFIDTTSSAEYCQDIVAEYDAGKDFAGFKNAYKLGEYEHGATDTFYIWLDPTNHLYGNHIYVYIDEDSEETAKKSLKNVRYVESNDIQGVKVEFFAATNIAKKEHVYDLLKPQFSFDSWSLNKFIKEETDEHGNTRKSYDEISRKGLLVHADSNPPKIIFSPAKEPYYTYNAKIVEISYVVVITHNPSVKVLPINSQVNE